MNTEIYLFIGLLYNLIISRSVAEKNWDLLYLLKNEKNIHLTDEVTLNLTSSTNYSQIFLSAKQIFTDNSLPQTFVILAKLKLSKRLTKPATLLSLKDPNSKTRLQISFKTISKIIDKYELNVFYNPIFLNDEGINLDLTLPFTKIEEWKFALLFEKEKIILYASCQDIKQPSGYQSVKVPKNSGETFFSDGAIMHLFSEDHGMRALTGEIHDLSFSNSLSKLSDLCDNGNIEGSGSKKFKVDQNPQGNHLLVTEMMDEEDSTTTTESTKTFLTKTLNKINVSDENTNSDGSQSLVNNQTTSTSSSKDIQTLSSLKPKELQPNRTLDDSRESFSSATIKNLTTKINTNSDITIQTEISPIQKDSTVTISKTPSNNLYIKDSKTTISEDSEGSRSSTIESNKQNQKSTLSTTKKHVTERNDSLKIENPTQIFASFNPQVSTESPLRLDQTLTSPETTSSFRKSIRNNNQNIEKFISEETKKTTLSSTENTNFTTTKSSRKDIIIENAMNTNNDIDIGNKIDPYKDDSRRSTNGFIKTTPDLNNVIETTSREPMTEELTDSMFEAEDEININLTTPETNTLSTESTSSSTDFASSSKSVTGDEKASKRTSQTGMPTENMKLMIPSKTENTFVVGINEQLRLKTNETNIKDSISSTSVASMESSPNTYSTTERSSYSSTKDNQVVTNTKNDDGISSKTFTNETIKILKPTNDVFRNYIDKTNSTKIYSNTKTNETAQSTQTVSSSYVNVFFNTSLSIKQTTKNIMDTQGWEKVFTEENINNKSQTKNNYSSAIITERRIESNTSFTTTSSSQKEETLKPKVTEVYNETRSITLGQEIQGDSVSNMSISLTKTPKNLSSKDENLSTRKNTTLPWNLDESTTKIRNLSEKSPESTSKSNEYKNLDNLTTSSTKSRQIDTNVSDISSTISSTTGSETNNLTSIQTSSTPSDLSTTTETVKLSPSFSGTASMIKSVRKEDEKRQVTFTSNSTSPSTSENSTTSVSKCFPSQSKESGEPKQRSKTETDLESDCKIVTKLRLSIPQKGEKGERGIKGERGTKGDPGPSGADGSCDSKACVGYIIKGDKGEPGSCKENQCLNSRSLKGLIGPKGEIGLKGEKGDEGSINIDLIKHLTLSIIKSEMESLGSFRNLKGEKGSPGKCKCDQPGFTYYYSPMDRIEETLNVGHGSIVLENREYLEQISSRLPLGSLVFILKSGSFMVKVDQNYNIWRSIALDSKFKDWILPVPMSTSPPELPRSPPIPDDSKKLHVIALSSPTMGDLKQFLRQPGGHSGAMFQCQQAGAVNGFGRAFYPLINTDSFSIKYIVKKIYSNIGIYNARSELMANDYSSFISGNEDLQNEILDFKKNPISSNILSPCVWIGKEPVQNDLDYEKNSNSKCLNWMSRDPFVSGLAAMITPHKSLFEDNNRQLRSCSQQCYILCIQTELYES